MMNWLSHILLSKNDIDYQLGNLLADAIKGKAWDGASAHFSDGVSMHKAIDSFADSHAVVSRSKARLGEKGYLKGVVVDVLYDHFLSTHWDNYSSVPLPDFLDTFHENAVRAAQPYPEKLTAFVEMLVASNRLAKYGSFDGFVSTIQRMDTRLPERIRQKEYAESYIPAVESEYKNLEGDFLSFFPELVSFFKTHDLGCRVNHILV